ncbi:hypothetical protein [Paenibacillus wynnii]|uniref:hypothetical protein n=1 Tax=Paenibacillus wynnii TaxID=268407 RepID=UPI00278D2AA8|nr:hypothetical protein [Paenibacillus wynnii]MDQ0193790.1 putative membrane protein YeaQ/YmgE (transglycosylase-associated protein family) [Paenibacillus wynnii]
MPSWIVAAIFYSFMTCWSFGFIYRFRSKLTSTIAMISPMVIGMIIGFGGGTIVGTQHNPNLLLSLFISVLIGILAGGIMGALISMGAFLNGALSGMMAGMMGVMLISMLPSAQWNQGIFAFMVIGGILHFVHTLMLQGQIQEESLDHSPWMFRTPALMLLVTVALLSIYAAGGHVQMPEKTQQPSLSGTNGHSMPH